MKPHTYWKRKYEALCAAIQEVHEKASLFDRMGDPIPDECDSESDEFFISNAMEVSDNENYAKKHWGDGKYFRVVREPS